MERPKITKNNVQQTIDLEEVFGVDLSGHRDIKEAMGEALIQRMRERVQSGTGMRPTGQRYDLGSVPYNPAYAKNKGVGRRDVDMTLLGDMLDNIDIVKSKGSAITLGFADKLEATKAYAHTVGRQGDKTVNVPARPFFGVNGEDIKAIKREFGSELKRLIKQAAEDPEELEKLEKRLLARLRGGDE